MAPEAPWVLSTCATLFQVLPLNELIALTSPVGAPFAGCGVCVQRLRGPGNAHPTDWPFRSGSRQLVCTICVFPVSRNHTEPGLQNGKNRGGCGRLRQLAQRRNSGPACANFCLPESQFPHLWLGLLIPALNLYANIKGSVTLGKLTWDLHFTPEISVSSRCLIKKSLPSSLRMLSGCIPHAWPREHFLQRESS